MAWAKKLHAGLWSNTALRHFVIFAEVRDKNQDNQRAKSCSISTAPGLANPSNKNL
jgi:hypothetical protein